MSNRDRLIDAAADLFHRSGYRRTTLEEILRTTGIARSNLYYHFESKSALALAVVDRWVERYEEDLVAPALDRFDLPPLARIACLYRRAAESQDPAAGRTGCPLGRLATELAHSEPAVRRRLDAYFSELRARVSETLREGRPEASLRQCARAAHLVVSALEGSLLLADLRADPSEIACAGESLVELLAAR